MAEADSSEPAPAGQPETIQMHLDFGSPADYALFLRAKALPRWRLRGRVLEVPGEYAHLLGRTAPPATHHGYVPSSFLFDYQAAISRVAIRKRKYAVFAECGLGKTLVLLEFARHCVSALAEGRRVLIVCPPMVVEQTIGEARRFYGDVLPLSRVRAAGLQAWLDGGGPAGVGVTNYEALAEGLRPGRLGALICDESSVMKSHYGAWGRRLIDLGRGLDWKLCLTGTPAPNDRIEYATHAVFLDQFPTVNAFLARYFVNRGKTDNRWELKPHALKPFYRSLSDWCVFLRDPATYGWKDNPQGSIPPIEVHIHDVPLTDEQQALVASAGGDMFGTPGGITSRAKLAQLAKGRHNGVAVASNKAAFIRDLIASWPGESTLVWCRFNAEQEEMAASIPGAASIAGATKEADRERIIRDFQAGRTKVVVTKPEILGYGLNLHVAWRQVFSTLQDSYEEYHQAVKRSNRIGSTRPLNVHVPVTPIERAMVDNVLRKARMVDRDTAEQEALFREVGHAY